MQLASDMTSLILKHHEEVEDQRIPLAPDYNTYMEIEKLGMFHGFTARKDGKLIGYATYTTMPMLHHLTTKAAVCDLLYITPEHRGGWLGVKLLKFSESVLKDRGADLLIMNIKTKHDFGAMLKRLGYEHTEVQYSKHLGD